MKTPKSPRHVHCHTCRLILFARRVIPFGVPRPVTLIAALVVSIGCRAVDFDSVDPAVLQVGHPIRGERRSPFTRQVISPKKSTRRSTLDCRRSFTAAREAEFDTIRETYEDRLHTEEASSDQLVELGPLSELEAEFDSLPPKLQPLLGAREEDTVGELVMTVVNDVLESTRTSSRIPPRFSETSDFPRDA